MLTTIHRFSSDSSTASEYSSKRHGSRSPSWDSHSPIKVYIVQAKLDVQAIDELYSLIDSTTGSGLHRTTSHVPKLENCGNVSRADIIIANVSMRRRLERHVDWKLAQQKAIVTPQWLRDSVHEGRLLPCGDYAALRELHGPTEDYPPDCRDPEFKLPLNDSSHLSDLSLLPPTSESIKSNKISRFACARASPLVCPNQGLVAEIAVIHKSRELEGKDINALSYERAIAVIKAYPRVITLQIFEEDILYLPCLGEKILSKIKEYVNKGTVQESQTIRASERFQALSTFTTVHGVGPSTARDLYNIGLRTIEDMERYYSLTKEDIEEDIFTPNGKRVSADGRLPELSIEAALTLRNDLQVKVSRAEVEEMHAVVMAELELIRHGCVSTIVGGYRRGKSESNDVDIVISHPSLRRNTDEVKDLCTSFVRQLYNRGLVTHVMHLSSFHTPGSLRTPHWDSLEKALTVFRLPTGGVESHVSRRLDLIFASPEAYWTAVVGWTGSKMFERDLRLWAKTEKGMKFDNAGLTRLHDSKIFTLKSEKEVFDILGLEWIDPTLRNANL